MEKRNRYERKYIYITDREILDTLRESDPVLSMRFRRLVANRYEQLLGDRDLLSNLIVEALKSKGVPEDK